MAEYVEMSSARRLNYLNDADFLKELDNQVIKSYQVKIDVLDTDELPIQSIVGRAQPGSSISIDGNSSVRRTCTLNLVAEEEKNDLTDVDNLLSVNKKIRILEGIDNHITKDYDDIIWFPLGIFVINQPSITHNTNSCMINLSCKDKMCLLNGECGGNLPTSITFHEYDQIIGERVCNGDPELVIDKPNNYTIYSQGSPAQYKSQSKEGGWVKEMNNSAVGTRIGVPQLFYDIIQTLVCNYGNESLSKIFINDVPLQIKQIVRQTGNGDLFYNTKTGQYTTNSNAVVGEDQQRVFKYNEDIGYEYTDFTYPGTLISNIGDNVCSVLDIIKNTLGNYEYFYDVKGNFIFQEIKNNLNTAFDATETFRLDNKTKVDGKTSSDSTRKLEVDQNDLSILDQLNYEVNFYGRSRSTYTFTEGNGLVTAYTNTPNYMNLKNDYHIQGKSSDGYAIHYHVAIKEKPASSTHRVVFLEKDGKCTGRIRVAQEGEEGVEYTPNDQRAELYIRGLEKQLGGIRPDVYEQELLDLFDSIYEFCYYDDNNEFQPKGRFKADIIIRPNELNYFFDYIEPISKLYDCSIDLLGTKIYSYQQDKIRKLYNYDIPNVILLNTNMDDNYREEIISLCDLEGQLYTNVTDKIYKKIAIGTIGYTAQEVARDLLYQHTGYNESISIQSIPIYYLDTNTRISVYDQKSGISGDYIIKSMSVPLEAGGTMSITASRALERL